MRFAIRQLVNGTAAASPRNKLRIDRIKRNTGNCLSIQLFWHGIVDKTASAF